MVLATAHGPISQGAFLERMGLQLRVDSLTRSASSPDRSAEINDAAQRLVSPTGMGGQYQVLGITSKREGEGAVWPFVEKQ